MGEENGIVMRVTELVKDYGEVRAVAGISFAIPIASVFTMENKSLHRSGGVVRPQTATTPPRHAEHAESEKRIGQ